MNNELAHLKVENKIFLETIEKQADEIIRLRKALEECSQWISSSTYGINNPIQYPQDIGEIIDSVLKG